MDQPQPQQLSLEMLAARPWLGKRVTHDSKTWKVASIRADHPAKPWAWLVNVKKPMEQVRLSMRADAFRV